MDRAPVLPQDYLLNIGDRVRIRPDRWPLLGLVNQTGTVVEIMSVPRDSCLVRVDGDSKDDREWFFYRADVVRSDR